MAWCTTLLPTTGASLRSPADSLRAGVSSGIEQGVCEAGRGRREVVNRTRGQIHLPQHMVGKFDGPQVTEPAGF